MLVLAAVQASIAQSLVPSPEQFFGFRIGTDRRLANWNRMVEYFQTVDRLSDRVIVEDLGPTTDGRPYLLATVASPSVIADLPRFRRMQQQLADPATTEAEAARIVRDGKVVVLIGAGVHANEVGSSQMTNELLYELATSDEAWVRHVLDNAIVLIVPSQNPDGLQMTAEWYARNVGTPYEDAPLPELYHRYAGHDNNRDAYMLTQRESQYLARVLYHEWLPEVYLDQHQMGSGRARIFVPPYTSPPNPNVDPLVWTEANLLGQAMAARLQEAGKTGVVWGEVYSGSWQGAGSTNPWWHNMVGLLSEVASTRLAGPVYQPPRDPHAGEPPPIDPRDTIIPAPEDGPPRMNYPQPWPGGRWTFADVVDYHRLAAVGVLEAAAANRERLVRNFYGMNRRTIERFANGSPYAFLVPPGQRDPIVALHLLGLLHDGGAIVERATAGFTAGGVGYPAGTAVVRLAQPFGRWVKDLLEAQAYGDVRWAASSAPDERPYDVTAWSLGLLMGVDVIAIDRPFAASLARFDPDAMTVGGGVHGSGTVFVVPHEPNASINAMARLLDYGASVSWTQTPITVNDRAFAQGAIVVRDVQPRAIERLAETLSLQVEAVADVPAADAMQLRQPRVAVYEPWGGAIDAGWTRWVLEQHGVRYTRVRAGDVREDAFPARYDVLVLPEMPDGLLIRGLQGSSIRPEHRGGLGDEGLLRLRAFVDRGGTIVALGASSQFVVDRLGLPLRSLAGDLDQESYSCPGALLRAEVDGTHPIGFGLPARVHAMVIGNGGFEPAGHAAPGIRTVVRYPDGDLLESGWMIGDDVLRGGGAVLDVPVGRGRVILMPFRVQHRGQTLGTVKLLLNALYYAAAVTRPVTAPTMQQ
jgi:hypothetical protein